MIDDNLKQLPGFGGALGVLYALGAVDALLVVGQAWGLAAALAGVWAGGPLEDQLAWVALFFASFLMRYVVRYGRDRFMDGYARTRTAELRQQLLERIVAAGPALVQRRGSGSVALSLMEGIDQVREYVGLLLPKVTDLMVVPAVLAVALLLFDWVSAVIALVMLPCIMGYMRMLGVNARLAAERQHDEFDRMGNHFVDTLRGMGTLVSFGRSEGYARTVFEASERFRRATMKTLRAAFLSSLVLDLFRTFALAAVAIMLGFRLMAGDIELFCALAALVIVPEYFAAIRRYSADFHASLEGKNQLAAICEVLAEPAMTDVFGDGVLPEVHVWGEESRLELEGICFGYPGEDHQALRDVRLSLSGFETVGIVGMSGSGKSTLAQLVAGFSSPGSGEVRVINGDQELSLPSCACPSWQRQVAYIPQSPHIFHGTLRDNVAFYHPAATDEAILDAMSVVGLDALVASLPEGLDAVIGEAGRTLSGGQAQRIALARALLDDQRRIIVFDEPTAHLDIETELALKQRMLPFMEGRLVLFATHRLHWMADMDRIVVLDQGGVAEEGTLAELLSHDGPFRRLSAQLSLNGFAESEEVTAHV